MAPTTTTSTPSTSTSFTPAAGPARAELPSAVDFGQRVNISARSVLVTIFGDSVVPAGGEIWLGDLIELCRQFGFNDRLVRTSMFRLGAEGWFDVDRVGRRSLYRLTARAMAEFADAEARIYGPPTAPDWDGEWTLVFLDAASLDRGDADEVRASLAPLGFATLSAGTLAAPRIRPDLAQRVAEAIGHREPVPTASARIDDLPALAASGWPEQAYGLGAVSARYQAVLDRYGPLTTAERLPPEATTAGPEAFALRTMVVHELRRARLADPDLPATLLPPAWPGPAAVAVAAAVYHRVAEPADAWLASVTDLQPGPEHRRHRFPTGRPG